LREILEEKLKRKSTAEWIEAFGREGIACGPIYTVDQVFKDKQVMHQDMLQEIEHPTAGLMKMIGFPVKLQRTPCATAMAPPCLGQHTREILKSLDYAENDIDELEQSDII
jgi:crotonobetainyl-CoA:carnitine CoA-transferase CaiB-like acyl-CoA transferase